MCVISVFGFHMHSTDLQYHVIPDGMIIFPAAGVFTDLGPMGVSMFFVSCVFFLI